MAIITKSFAASAAKLSTRKKKMKLKPLFKTTDDKCSLSQWIIDNFPENYQDLDYVEPFCGNAIVFFNKAKSSHNVINDTNLGVYNILRALRDEPSQFIKKVKSFKFTEKLFLKEQTKNPDDFLEIALREFLLRRSSVGGQKIKFLQEDNIPELIEQLKEMAEKLQDIFIFNKPAQEVITAFDHPNALFYCKAPDEVVMSLDEHMSLSKILFRCNGKVVINNISSPLYNRLYKEWRCVEKPVKNKKTECLWMNF